MGKDEKVNFPVVHHVVMPAMGSVEIDGDVVLHRRACGIAVATRRWNVGIARFLWFLLSSGLRCWLGSCMFISCCPARMVQVLAWMFGLVWWWFENSRACFV
ncbi:hypothetical protein KIH77_05015, partial [Bifidobacterium sp. 82T24]|uniref:hypothetical protein n=1 Tax=Bifidobacterium pluvialisilvae TaxID=2834436 RepID=UPI001C595C2F